MSDTPHLADECKKLLDNGWIVMLWKNDLGSFSASARKPKRYRCKTTGLMRTKWKQVITDDFEPSQALYRLTEKVYGNIV